MFLYVLCTRHLSVLNKMCTACYVLRNIKHIVPIDTLRVIYFAHIHSIISYGIIFGGNFSYANKVFILQKKIIRILTNARPRDSCRKVFKSLEIMTLYSQYIYSLVLYTINNKHLFDANNEIHKYKTRNNNNLHCPIANLSKFNNGAYTGCPRRNVPDFGRVFLMLNYTDITQNT